MYTEAELEEMANEALKNGNWMIRRSDGGKAYGGFQWSPVGEWTVSPDWNLSPVCGNGLHGVGAESSGWYSDGKDVDFCITEGYGS